MEDFIARYRKTCKENGTLPSEAVLQQSRLLSDNTSLENMFVLDLSSFNFTPEDCNVLGKTLQYDHLIKEISFSDCLLSEDSCKYLLLGLMHNSCIRKLDLKGNNIRCGGAEIVALFLKRNASVEQLFLPWNALGMWDSGIAALSEGLAVNQSLRVLDLRNNQINHEGANELAKALKRNFTLKHLDLRWNNIGILGGRALLVALQQNRTIISVEVTGNNIPHDVVRSIEVLVQRNKDRQAADEEQRAKNEIFSQRMQEIEFDKRNTIQNLMDEIGKEKDISRTTQLSVEQLRLALDERKSAFNSLATKLSSTEGDLDMTKTRAKEQDSVIKKLQNQLEEEKNDRLRKEELHKKESDAANDVRIEMESKITELERKNKSLQKKIKDLENQGAEDKQKYKKESHQAEEKHITEVKELQQKYDSELKNLYKKHDEHYQTVKEKVERLEKENLKLEEEVSQLRSKLVSEKLKSEEDIMSLKTKLKHEELMRAKQYEERIDLLQASRDDLQNQSNKQTAQITELQSQLGGLSRETETFKRSADNLKQQLDLKEMESRSELNRSRKEMETERKSLSEMQERIASLEGMLTELKRSKMDEIALRDNEIISLKERLLNKEKDIQRRQEEEMRRAELLESAIFSYVSSTKSASQSSSPIKM